MRSIIQDGSDDWPPTKEGALHIIKEENGNVSEIIQRIY